MGILNDMKELKANKKSNPIKTTLLACRLMFKHALVFGCLINILMLSTPLYSMQVLDRVISSSNTDTLLFLTLVIIFALLLLSLLTAARSFATNQMGSWFEKELSSKIFANAIKTALVNKAAGGSQQLRDLQSIKTFITSPAMLSMLDIPWALIFIVVLFIIHFYMGIMTVIGGAMLFGLAILSDRLTKPLHDSSNEHFIASMRQVDQATRNAEVVQVMGLLPNIDSSWQNINRKVQDAQVLVSNRQTVLSELTKFIRFVLQILVTGIGAYLVLKHEMSVGAIIACSSISGRALAPFEQAITSWKSFLNFQQAYKRLNETVDKYYTDDVKMSLPAPKGAIAAENLFFTPPGASKHTIKGVSCEIAAGEAVAVIGPSGSGKTSLAKILVGAWAPQMGVVRIDGANINDWNRSELGQNIGYLPQDVELFHGTVRENIGRMNKKANPELVVKAAQLAGVHDMILQLPKGYDTEIGIDGTALSGGQRQRIGLARAFFGSPRIIVLDEPNASLDAMGEEALAKAILAAKADGVTVIMISHRTTALSLVDKIMVIKEGTLAAFGPKDQILAMMQGKQPVEAAPAVQPTKQTAEKPIKKKNIH